MCDTIYIKFLFYFFKQNSIPTIISSETIQIEIRFHHVIVCIEWYWCVFLYYFCSSGLTHFRPSTTYPVDLRPSTLHSRRSFHAPVFYVARSRPSRKTHHPYAWSSLWPGFFSSLYRPENLRAIWPSTVFKRHVRCLIEPSSQISPFPILQILPSKSLSVRIHP